MLASAVLATANENSATSAIRQELMEIVVSFQDRIPTTAELLSSVISIALLVGVCFVAWLIADKVLKRIALALIRRTKTTWDDAMVDAHVFDIATLLVPLIIFAVGILGMSRVPVGLGDALSTFVIGFIFLHLARLASAILNGVNAIYVSSRRVINRPIKGYIQIGQVLVYLTGIVCMVSFWVGENPLLFLSGIGAMSAVLMLVFRDTLLSLVAGIQLTSTDLIRMGDWIEMETFGADGTVTDIALNTVTVQNFDRTLTLIPTHKFLEHSFRNWRHVFDSKARRIKRHILFDATSVHFLSPEDIDRLRQIVLLRPYLDARCQEVDAHNQRLEEEGIQPSLVNRRALTNLGTFRAYANAYIQAHPLLRKDLVMMVRQLQPTDDGIPLEIYAFTSDPTWTVYEGIQADIFDHFFSVIPEFGLRQYQAPAGTDIRTAGRSLGEAVHAIEAGRERRMLGDEG